MGHPEAADSSRSDDILQKLVNRLAGISAVKPYIGQALDEVLEELDINLTEDERQRLLAGSSSTTASDYVGVGTSSVVNPLTVLLEDPDVSDIIILSHDNIHVMRDGIRQPADVDFMDEDHLHQIIHTMSASGEVVIDESSSIIHTKLRDGSRVIVALPPVSPGSVAASIHKGIRQPPLTAQDLIESGTATTEMMAFLQACVVSGFNIIVSGGVSSGRTTLLNILLAYIPVHEYIILIGDTARLAVSQEWALLLEPVSGEGSGQRQVLTRELVVQALRMAPDRIIVRDLCGGEVLDLIQAMNTGYYGSIGSMHANNPRDTVKRLETLSMLSGMNLPARAIREQIASAIHLIVHIDRLRDGSRKITRVTEVQGMEGDVVTMSDIFVFEQTGIDGDKIIGRIMPTGLRPKNMDRILDAGIHLPPSTFGIGHR